MNDQTSLLDEARTDRHSHHPDPSIIPICRERQFVVLLRRNKSGATTVHRRVRKKRLASSALNDGSHSWKLTCGCTEVEKPKALQEHEWYSAFRLQALWSLIATCVARLAVSTRYLRAACLNVRNFTLASVISDCWYIITCSIEFWPTPKYTKPQISFW